MTPWRRQFDRIICDTRPFVWGEWDCLLRCAAAVQAKSGVDIAQDVRGRYGDIRGAVALLSEMECETPADLVGRYLTEIAPLQAMPGDVADLPSDDAMGCLGLVAWGRVSGLRPDGPVTVPLTEARRAFRA